MNKRISMASGMLVIVAAVFALLLALAVPALAHHKEDHAQGTAASQDASSEDDGSDKGKGGDNAKDNDGDADNDSGTAYTEDNDTNDGGTPNNVPDDDGRGPDRSNGGPDKPNGSGGVDKADQDGNNGCGNDDDFEDDNEGWCGRKPKPAKPARPAGSAPEGPCDADATMAGIQPCEKQDDKPCDADATMSGTQPCKDDEVDADAAVLPDLIYRPAAGDETPEEVTDVLGERLTQGLPAPEAAAQRNASFLGRQLPFTGSALMGYAALALGLLLAGAGLLTARRRA